MKRHAVWLGAIAAGVLVWFASPELHWPARLFTALLLGPAPIVFIQQAIAAHTLPRPLPRTAIYVGSSVGLWLLALAAVSAALLSGFTVRLLGLSPMPAQQFVIWTGFAIFACAAIVAAFRAFGFRDTEIMRDIVPVSTGEKVAFTGLSVSAGICEEITFRGFLLPALTIATGSLAGGIVLSSAAFGILHAHQRPLGAVRAALLGAVLVVPFIVTGSLLASMAAHVLLDIAGGLWLARWLFR